MNENGGAAVYRECTPVTNAEFDDGADRPPSDVVVTALAEAEATDPASLPPLYQYVDVDALDALVERDAEAEDGDVLLTFRVETWTVFVRSDGRILVCDDTKHGSPKPVFDTSAA